jgi:hypothetical protein
MEGININWLVLTISNTRVKPATYVKIKIKLSGRSGSMSINEDIFNWEQEGNLDGSHEIEIGLLNLWNIQNDMLMKFSIEQLTYKGDDSENIFDFSGDRDYECCGTGNIVPNESGGQ